MKIFGREPARFIGLITALVILLGATPNPWVSAGAAAAIAVAIGAVFTALTTRDPSGGVPVSLVSGAVAAIAAVFAEYAIHAPDTFVTALTSVAFLIGNFALVRDQSKPKETVVSSS